MTLFTGWLCSTALTLKEVQTSKQWNHTVDRLCAEYTLAVYKADKQSGQVVY